MKTRETLPRAHVPEEKFLVRGCGVCPAIARPRCLVNPPPSASPAAGPPRPRAARRALCAVPGGIPASSQRASLRSTRPLAVLARDRRGALQLAARAAALRRASPPGEMRSSRMRMRAFAVVVFSSTVVSVAHRAVCQSVCLCVYLVLGSDEVSTLMPGPMVVETEHVFR